MATEVISLSTEVWTRVTAAGESGTCWKTTQGPVVIDHTASETAATLPLTNTNVAKDKAKRVPLDRGEVRALTVLADGSSDIFYALSLSDVDAKIVMDIV